MNMFDTFSNEECKAEKDENSKTSLQKIITPKNTEDEYAVPMMDFSDLQKKYRADTPRLPEPLHKTSHRLSHSWDILPDIIRTLCILRQNTDWQAPFHLRHPFSPDTLVQPSDAPKYKNDP